jgi:hypothetical protein
LSWGPVFRMTAFSAISFTCEGCAKVLPFRHPVPPSRRGSTSMRAWMNQSGSVAANTASSPQVGLSNALRTAMRGSPRALACRQRASGSAPVSLILTIVGRFKCSSATRVKRIFLQRSTLAIAWLSSYLSACTSCNRLKYLCFPKLSVETVVLGAPGAEQAKPLSGRAFTLFLLRRMLPCGRTNATFHGTHEFDCQDKGHIGFGHRRQIDTCRTFLSVRAHRAKPRNGQPCTA